MTTPLIVVVMVDFGAWFSEQFAGESIMTLDELLEV